MKKILAITVFFTLCAINVSWGSGIYSNGTSSEDSLVMSVFISDSLGNPSGTQADSFYISVVGPSGDSTITIAGVAATAGLNIDSLDTKLVGWKYLFSDAISEIDGSGRVGTYEVTFCAKDNSPEYINCVSRSFQIVDDNLSVQLAEIADILDSLQNQDNWVSGEASLVTAGEIMDSASNRGFVHYDSSQADLVLKSIVVSNSAGDAVQFTSTGGNGDGLQLKGNGAGLGFEVEGGVTGRGARFRGGTSGGDAVTMQARGFGDAGLNISGDGPGADIIGVWSDTNFSASYYDSTQGMVTSDTVLIKAVAQNNADLFYGPTASGSGSDLLTIYAIDTSGSDQARSDVKISVKTLAGADYAVGYSSSGGYTIFNVDAVDTFLVTGKSPGFVWPGDDTIVVVGSQTDSLFGYDIAVGTAASTNICRVYGYFYGIDGLPVEGVSVTARLTDGAVRHKGLIISPYRRTVQSDTAGYFYLDLIPSDSLNPAGTKYLISADYPSGTVLKKRLAIPDSSTWQMSW